MCEHLKEESMIHAVHFLLSHNEIGEKINTLFNYMTPLILLSYSEYIDEELAIKMSQVLLENGQDPNIRRCGKTALEIAKWRNRNKLAQFLQDYITTISTKKVAELKFECDLKDKEIENLKVVMEQMMENNQEKQCVICFERQISYICIPCGHRCVCAVCVIKMKRTCPVCRQDGIKHKRHKHIDGHKECKYKIFDVRNK
jgi:hypothetical protein